MRELLVRQKFTRPGRHY